MTNRKPYECDSDNYPSSQVDTTKCNDNWIVDVCLILSLLGGAVDCAILVDCAMTLHQVKGPAREPVQSAR